MSKLIITGVDGNFSSQVVKTIQQLAKKSDLILTAPSFSGLESYQKAGFTTRIANFNDKNSLEEAFKGGDILFLVSVPFVGEKRRRAHKNAIDGAKQAGVKKVVYTSLVNARDPENPSIEKIDHAYTEEYIENTDLDYIFLRNSQYAEAMITSYLTTDGILLSCQGDGKMAYISRKDCAIAAAYALTENNLNQAILDINGPELLTLAEFVKIGNNVTGMNVRVKDVSENEVYQAFDAIGVPRTTDGEFEANSSAPYSSNGMVTFARAIRIGKMNNLSNDFTKLTGKKARKVQYMFENYQDYQVGKRNSVDN